MKNIINFIFKLFIIFLDFFLANSKFFSLFNLIISSSDKHNNLKICCIVNDINDEYNILGSWFKIINAPFSVYILCIVSSVKKKVLIEKYNDKEIINRHIFILTIL